MSLDNGEINLIYWQKRKSGSFMTKLFEAMCAADETNLRKLGEGFPEEAKAYKRYRDETGYWGAIQKQFEQGRS